MEKLKPCRFCGSAAEFEFKDWDEETESGDDGMGWLKCQNNDCGVGFFGYCLDEKLYKKWNRQTR